MDVQFDRDEFDERQTALVGEIVRAIHDVLTEQGTPAVNVNELTASLAFSVCSILDGTRKGTLGPVLGFPLDAGRRKVVMLDAEQSWLHEYVHGWVTELYDTTPVTPHRKPTAPCPHCGKPLRTPTARYCRFCKMDWRDPGNVHKRA